MNRLMTRESQGQQCTDGGWFEDRTESLRKINPRSLSEPAKHPSCSVELQRTVGMKLVLKDPLASNNIGSSRTWYKIPCVIGQQRVELLLHGPAPIGISESAPVSARH